MRANEFNLYTIKGYIENIYIAEYTDKLLLLDGAARPDIEKIENFITKKLERSMSDLKLIVSTHMHPDHAGAAPFLRKKYNIPIAANEEVDQWYSGIGGAFQHRFDILMALYVVRKQKKTIRNISFPRKIKPDYLLKDNDSLPFFSDWKVLTAPGHTSHQIVLYQKKEEILYAADVLLRVNGKCQLPFPVELKKYGEQTLQKLSQLPIKTLLLAHGGISEDLDYKNIFLDLIPKLDRTLKFPITLMRFLSGYNPPLKRYRKYEKKMIK